MVKKWNVALGGAFALALLAGCGADQTNDASGGSAAAAQSPTAADGSAASQTQAADSGGQGAQNAGGGMRGGMGMADENGNPATLIGKIKSISGQTITVYKSSFDPSKMGARGGQNGGGQAGTAGSAPGGNGPDGGASGGGESAGGGAANGGAANSGAASDGAQAGGNAASGAANGSNGGRPGGFNRSIPFTDETEDITITDSTKLETTTFENNQPVTKEVSLADLKEGDVLTIWLKDGTQEAETVRVGGFGGGGRQGQGAGGRQNGQPSGQPSASPAASNDSAAG